MTVFAKKIVPLGQTAGYMEARRLAAEKGMGLASNVLHDDYLARTNRWQEVKAIYPAWGRELLVYPEINGEFAKGKDIVDSETGWCLPATYLTDPNFVNADVFQKGIGLFVDPEDVREENSRIVVIPASIVVLVHFIQEKGVFGRVDQATRIPLAEPRTALEERRFFYRISGVGVRPIVRGCDDSSDLEGYISREEVVSGGLREWPMISFGVAGESGERGAEKR